MESVAVYYYCTTARKHMQETGKTTRRILKRGQLMDKNVGYVLAVRMKPEGIFQSSSDSQRPFALLLIGRYHYPAKIATSFHVQYCSCCMHREMSWARVTHATLTLQRPDWCGFTVPMDYCGKESWVAGLACAFHTASILSLKSFGNDDGYRGGDLVLY